QTAEYHDRQERQADRHDFGLAKSVKGKSSLTMSGMVLGTPSYMAPEQAAGDLRHVGRWSDVYSLGATLYELLTGRPPFEGKTPFEVLAKVANEDPVPPSTRARGIPRDLETVCLRSMEKDWSRRYKTAKEFADDLGRVLAGEPIHARAISTMGRLAKRVRKNRAKLAPFVVAAVLIVAAVVVWLVLAARKERDYVEARRKADTAWAESRFNDALGLYARASELKPEDKEASDRIAECKRKLDEERDSTIARQKLAEMRRKEEEAARIREKEMREKAEKELRDQEAATANAREGRTKAEPFYAKGKQDLDNAAKDLYRPGADLVQMRARLKSAVDSLTEAVNLCATFHEALTDRGRVHVMRFDYDAAEKDFDKAIESARDYLPAYVERARLNIQRYIEALLDLGWITSPEVTARFEDFRDKAARDFEKAIELGADHQKAAFRAFVAFAERRLSDCVSYCDESLQSNPSQEDVLKLRGDANHFTLTGQAGNLSGVQKGFAEKAVADYTAALGLRFNFYEAHLMRGYDHFFLGMFDNAKTDYESALKLRPDDPLACWFMGTYYSRKSEGGDAAADKTAIEWFSRGIERKPDSFINLINRAVSFGRLGEYEKAIADLGKGLEINPAHAHGWYLKGAIYGRLRRYEEALEALQKAVGRDPNFPSAWYNIGAILMNLGREEEALPAFERAIKVGATNRAEIEKLIEKIKKDLGK
ncbi:MAG: tetratricopeptide repeat protein, partial [Planctomycetota bacterium]|nr:tetratricopeptide repeat protein [Planctomycetota bacterium]